MNKSTAIVIILFTFFISLFACRKTVPFDPPTPTNPIDTLKPIDTVKPVTYDTFRVKVSGIVMDTVKKKPLPNAKLYLRGGNPQRRIDLTYWSSVLGIFVADKDGKFSLTFTASTAYRFYGFTLGYEVPDGYSFQENYCVDPARQVSILEPVKNTENFVVLGRELNFLKLHLKVLSNPIGGLFMTLSPNFQYAYSDGNPIDTTLTFKIIPNYYNNIYFSTYSRRDTFGLDSLNATLPPNQPLYYNERELTYPIYTNLNDTMYFDITFKSILNFPVYRIRH